MDFAAAYFARKCTSKKLDSNFSSSGMPNKNLDAVDERVEKDKIGSRNSSVPIITARDSLGEVEVTEVPSP